MISPFLVFLMNSVTTLAGLTSSLKPHAIAVGPVNTSDNTSYSRSNTGYNNAYSNYYGYNQNNNSYYDYWRWASNSSEENQYKRRKTKFQSFVTMLQKLIQVLFGFGLLRISFIFPLMFFLCIYLIANGFTGIFQSAAELLQTEKRK